MNSLVYSQYLSVAREAALAAGELLRDQALHHQNELIVDMAEAHDIKLELDRRCQSLIEKILLRSFPHFAIYGEEGVSGDPEAEYQWIIDPIDGTVNFFYGIPHFAISIALRYVEKKNPLSKLVDISKVPGVSGTQTRSVLNTLEDANTGTMQQFATAVEFSKESIILGIIYDPMRKELWEAVRGGAFTLNDHPVHISRRTQLSEAVVSVGLSKSATTMEETLPQFAQMLRSVRKCRLMGSATLDIAYVACGRLDAYIEHQISLWDIAAGILMIEMAGGVVELKPHPTESDKYSIVACNPLIREQLKF